MDRESLYLRLPVPLQNVACTLEGWRVRRARFGGGFQGLLGRSEERLGWPEERLLEERDRRIRSFVTHCATTVPYYRRILGERGVEPAEIRSLADLSKFPILDKRTVQDHGAELVSTAVPERRRIMVHTSGTTGGGLRFPTTRDAMREQYAVWWRYFRGHGLRMGTWSAYVGGRSVVPLSQSRPPYWRTNYAGRQILFSGYHLSAATSAAYADALARARPPWLHGYPSLLALLASLLKERGQSIGYTPRWITTGAENLMPHQAALISEVFGVRPVQHYGMAEAVANISQCPLERLHVDEDFAAVEFLPNPAGPGHRIIGTNFSNPAFPLLRYDVGDLAAPDDGPPCPCGRRGRTVRSVDGRAEDYIVLRNGAILGRMDHIFKDMVRVREAQIVQERAGEITVRIVRHQAYGSDDEGLLREEFRKRVGDLASLRFEYVERLPRSPAGKLRFVVSTIDRPSAAGTSPATDAGRRSDS